MIDSDSEAGGEVAFHYCDETLTEVTEAFSSGRNCIVDFGGGVYRAIASVNPKLVVTLGSADEPASDELPSKETVLEAFSSYQTDTDDRPSASSDILMMEITE